MKRQFVCGMVSTIVLGLAVWAQTSAASSPQGSAGAAPTTGGEILRLHIAGPFVICEAKDQNKEDALEVLVPDVDGHFPPHWYSDFKDHAMDKKMTYRLKVRHSSASMPPPPKGVKLDQQTKNCEQLADKDDLLTTIWLPLPDQVIPIAPAKVKFDDNCKDSTSEDGDLYATKVDFLYTNADLDNVLVCVDSDCSKPWFKAQIWPVNHVGNLSLEMAQVEKESSHDPHKMAKRSHRKMRHMVKLDEHCPHFSKQEGNQDSSASNLFGSHTDCHAPLLFACVSKSSLVCQQ